LIKGRTAALLLVALLSVFLAGSAESHANLASSEPVLDARIVQPPSELMLRFTQRLKPEGSWVQLKASDGVNIVQQVTFDQEDRYVMRGMLPQITPGEYTVSWQSLSADDDDYADGSFRFTLLNPDGSSPGGQGQATGGRNVGRGDGGGTSVGTLLAVVAAVALVGGAVVFVTRYRKGPA
jgi:methionine-rich copper-binding protein CopC